MILFVGVEGPEIRSTTRGIPTGSGTLLLAPCLCDVAGPTGGNGTSFPMHGMCVCVEFNYVDSGSILKLI